MDRLCVCGLVYENIDQILPDEWTNT